MKKIIFFVLLFYIMPYFVFASSNTGALVNGKYYDSLEDAISDANDGDVIKMFSDARFDKGIILNKSLTINLNNNTISAPTSVFEVRKGTLKLEGSGVIKEMEPYYGAVRLIGNSVPTDEKYTNLYVGKDVTLEGWTGVFISHENNKSYGVNAYISGKINAIDDISGGTGIGVYVNGNIKNEKFSPSIFIMDGAAINSTGDGLYIGGYTNVYIKKASISGKEAGIAIKSGILNIDGASVSSNGIDYTPTEGYNNGIRASGTAIQIESNNGYAGNMEINIKDGIFTSKNSFVIYEYVGKGNQTQVKSINISGGEFISEANKEVIAVSDEFKYKHNSFLTGGLYSSNPKEFLVNGYSIDLDNNLYVVGKGVIKEVFGVSDINDSSYVYLFIVLILGVIIYFYRDRIKILLKK